MTIFLHKNITGNNNKIRYLEGENREQLQFLSY